MVKSENIHAVRSHGKWSERWISFNPRVVTPSTFHLKYRQFAVHDLFPPWPLLFRLSFPLGVFFYKIWSFPVSLVLWAQVSRKDISFAYVRAMALRLSKSYFKPGLWKVLCSRTPPRVPWIGNVPCVACTNSPNIFLLFQLGVRGYLPSSDLHCCSKRVCCERGYSILAGFYQWCFRIFSYRWLHPAKKVSSGCVAYVRHLSY